MEGTGLKKKDLKRFREILLAKKKEILRNAQRTLNEDMTLDADDLPDEMDLASSEYLHSFTFRLRGREKVFLQKIDHALEKIKEGTFGVCEQCGEPISHQAARGAPGNDPVHPLQGRSGTDRKGVRLSGAPGGAVGRRFRLASGSPAAPGRWPSNRAARRSARTPTVRCGTPRCCPSRVTDTASRRRGASGGPTTRPRSWLARSCAQRAPWSAMLPEARRRSAICRVAAGGGSAEHRSHQSGRDVDVFFYGVDRDGASAAARGRDAALRARRACRALVAAQGCHAAARRAVPAARFDARRNWAFVRALLSDPEVEVQFDLHSPRAGGRADARSDGGGRRSGGGGARVVHHAPAERLRVHDDHMHIRLYCEPSDRSLGCVDKGPVRWWKKMWKYMGAPYGRPAIDVAGRGRPGAVGRLFRGELPASFAGSSPTS